MCEQQQSSKPNIQDEFIRIEGWDDTLDVCPFCGSPAEMWEHSPNSHTHQKVVMCSCDGRDGDDEPTCPMYMPPQGFYKASKQQARDAWNTRAR